MYNIIKILFKICYLIKKHVCFNVKKIFDNNITNAKYHIEIQNLVGPCILIKNSFTFVLQKYKV